MSHRIFSAPVSDVHPHYAAKTERTGRTEAEVREAIAWLTGLDDDEVATGRPMEKVLRG